MKSLLAAAVLVVALAGHAVAQEMEMEMGEGGQAASSRAFEAANQTMMKAMAVPMTGNPDRDFASTMIVHHQGAIAAAKVELQYGKDPQLRALAEEIVVAQENEIEMMKKWLADNPE